MMTRKLHAQYGSAGVKGNEADAIPTSTMGLSYADNLHLLSNSQVNLCCGLRFQPDGYKYRISIIAAYGGSAAEIIHRLGRLALATAVLQPPLAQNKILDLSWKPHPHPHIHKDINPTTGTTFQQALFVQVPSGVVISFWDLSRKKIRQ